jgi:hypothetical protein
MSKRSTRKKTGIGLALVGVAVLAVGGNYDMQTFRSSPKEPDATHTVMQESHGVQRFKTQTQARTFLYLNVVGVSLFLAGAALLTIDHYASKRST